MVGLGSMELRDIEDAPSWAPWGRHYFAWAVGSGVAMFGLFLWLLLLGAQGAVPRTVVGSLDALVQLFSLLFVTVAVISAAVYSQGRGRWAWTFISGAFGAMFIASGAWLGQGVPSAESDLTVAIIVATYVACFPAAIAGVLFLNPFAWRAGALARTILDASIIATSVFFMAWAFFLEDLFRTGKGTTMARVLNLSFPVLDLLIMAVALTVAARVNARERGTLILLVAGFGVFAITDGLYGPLALNDGYYVGHPIDAGYLLGMILLGIAALRRVIWQSPNRNGPARIGLVSSLIPFVPVLGGVFAAGFVLARDGRIEPFLVWVGVIMITLVVARQALVLIENDRLTRTLDRAGRFKSDLLRYVSHEAATPLTPMKVHLHMLSRAAPAEISAVAAKSMPVLERNLSRLEGLVAEVLDLAHVDGGRFQIEPRRLNLATIISASLDAYRPQLHDRDLRLDCDLQRVEIDADGSRIGQVLDNLLSNALKFTPIHGSLTVRLRQAASGARIEVADSGVGMDSGQLKRLFTPFGRVHSGHDVSAGNGLGLYLCKAIVEQHGGRISCESPGPGRGSRFIVDLPGRGAVS